MHACVSCVVFLGCPPFPPLRSASMTDSRTHHAVHPPIFPPRQPLNKPKLEDLVQGQVRTEGFGLRVLRGCVPAGLQCLGARVRPCPCHVATHPSIAHPKPEPPSNQYVEYINQLHYKVVFQIIDAANFLGIEPLLSLALAWVAFVLKGKEGRRLGWWGECRVGGCWLVGWLVLCTSCTPQHPATTHQNPPITPPPPTAHGNRPLGGGVQEALHHPQRLHARGGA